MKPLSVVCWKWGNLYSIQHVNALYRSFETFFHHPFFFFCVTDQYELDFSEKSGRVILIHAWRDWPSKDIKDGKELFRQRTRIYDPGFGMIFGKRFLQIDLGVLIVGDITSLLLDRSEPFVVWKQPPSASPKPYECEPPYSFLYNPSLMLLDAGQPPGLWESFSSEPSKWVSGHVKARRAGRRAKLHVGDQGILCHYLGTHPDAPNPVPVWTEEDGVFRFSSVRGKPLPDNAKVLMFDGHKEKDFLLDNKWIEENIRRNPNG